MVELVAPELVELEVKGGLEEQPGQEDREEQLLGEHGRLDGVGGAQHEAGPTNATV